ncbi:MAG: hypothetical protein V7720_01285 [Halioglobus sp.]
MTTSLAKDSTIPVGEFITLDGERYYAIYDVDHMDPFLISLASDSDHWMFVASNGGLTAGRVSPETALFPYITVDNIYDSTGDTGSKTLIRVGEGADCLLWEPFNAEKGSDYSICRNLYRNHLGNKLVFEEVNNDLELCFRYTWASSERYGFVRSCSLQNRAAVPVRVAILDGLQNILPAGTPRHTQTDSSYLVDAYKLNQLDVSTGLAFYALFSGISDRAEPKESLRANTVFCLGLDQPPIVLSAAQIQGFKRGEPICTEQAKRGIRGAYLVNIEQELAGGAATQWQFVMGSELSQAECSQLRAKLADPDALAASVQQDVVSGSDRLARIMASADGYQCTSEETVTTHHYANVLYNVFRGGIPDDQYQVSAKHLRGHVRHFNRDTYERNRPFLEALPQSIGAVELLEHVNSLNQPQLMRLTMEYLPITFGRRHGDPSRPWNLFEIRLRDEQGDRLLTYQGNWRDIFQNWEALLLSYPEFIENVIAKFVNASTVDGFNPYRMTSEGIDWEVEDPEDPWSYIGYWGDHQIIYLLKLLELSCNFHPDRLSELLHQPLFSYANVPYRIKPFEALLEDPKSTVVFDADLAGVIESRVSEMGADGKLVLDKSGQVYQVTLLEKLLVTLLTKVSNLVVDGGIWLNTQRPEWNDANNALVGNGLSMVTLYYLRRYLLFMQGMTAQQKSDITVSNEVADWLHEAVAVLQQNAHDEFSTRDRQQFLMLMGQAYSRYRARVYAQEGFSGTRSITAETIGELLETSLQVIDSSIQNNLREDGLYHAYNLLDQRQGDIQIEHLYPMLEGQVAVLSSGALQPRAVIDVLQSLFDSAMFTSKQDSFLLYPDREVAGFLDKNLFAREQARPIALIEEMLGRGDQRIVEPDGEDSLRFSPNLINVNALDELLLRLHEEYPEESVASGESLRELYESVFNHRAFTGRSGGMFAFEGLGSIYWHMISKLLLAIQENFYSASRQRSDAEAVQTLGDFYYRVRKGIGFNKSPADYGAFPTDPYSHTPAHLGAQQPGMTGQVKEEILTRFGELGVHIVEGSVQFDVALLREVEFATQESIFTYLDTQGEWQEVAVPAKGLAFTYWQVPIVYRLSDAGSALSLIDADDQVLHLEGLEIPQETASALFRRNGRIKRIELTVSSDMLFTASN